MLKNRYSSSQLAKKKKRRKIFRAILLVTFILSVFGGIVFWFNHPVLNISSFEISAVEFANKDDIHKEVNQILNDKKFFLFSNKNIFFLPKTKIREALINSNHSIQGVSMRILKFDLLEINITEYSYSGKWCGNSKEEEIDPCYLLNKEGQIFAKEKALDKKNTLTFFSPLIEFEKQEELESNILGKQYLPVETFKNIVTFAEYLPEFDIHVKEIVTKDNETFSVITTEDLLLMIDYQDQAQEILNNLKTVIETEEINEAQLSNLEYIDLRFGNKVYYKIK